MSIYRTHRCGELRAQHIGESVMLCGWVQRVRKLGGLLFVDLRDRWGIVQLVADDSISQSLLDAAERVGREWVLRVEGKVRQRSSTNPNMPTGEVEVLLGGLEVLNRSEVPPFTIEQDTDGGEELRMRYRYLDIRRAPVRDALLLRHAVAQASRAYLNGQDFCEVETPFLIKSTPEGARDFVVPSRMHAGEFYALPQSPQTFKQLLMVGGMERYYQIVRCFRDEDLRADRQPEFTQVDCEMSFVEREDILQLFEGYIRHVFKSVKGIDLPSPFIRMPYSEAMARYGSDKPDLRVGMAICDLSNLLSEVAFPPYQGVEYLGAICVPNGAAYTRKQLDALVEYVKRPQVGGGALVYIRRLGEGGFKSSADKHFDISLQQRIADLAAAKEGDLILMLAGKERAAQVALGTLRLEVARREGCLDPTVFAPLWVVDFPLLEWDEEQRRYFAMHHPFTSPVLEDVKLFDTDPGAIRANAYDMVINGTELGGGSIRIHDSALQARMFDALGFSKEQAEMQFGFLMNAFRYGAPPHGGIAFGFDRMCALLGGSDSIRDYIAFPKNNAGRDVMISSPSPIDTAQLDELGLGFKPRDL